MLESLLAKTKTLPGKTNQKPSKKKTVKCYAVTLNGSIVSIHVSAQACIAAMKYLKRLDVCMCKYRAHYTYEEVSRMRISYNKDGFNHVV